jgi:hypothetical protein
MDVYAIVVQLSPLSDCWVEMWAQHPGVKGCVVKPAYGERAFVCVRWRVVLSFAVEEL